MVRYRRNFVPGGTYFFTGTIAQTPRCLFAKPMDILAVRPVRWRDSLGYHLESANMDALEILPVELLGRQLARCAELRVSLSWRYRLSGRNGMPWGRWDPRYQPVGVCKVKRLAAPSSFVLSTRKGMSAGCSRGSCAKRSEHRRS